jgi:hypothetical protein
MEAISLTGTMTISSFWRTGMRSSNTGRGVLQLSGSHHQKSGRWRFQSAGSGDELPLPRRHRAFQPQLDHFIEAA